MTSCNYETDYSTVIGERILPFVFSLNTETSVLTPKPGEYQRFCYDIAGVGTDTPLYADLSHFLLGICSAITQEDILDVTVVIDGKPQNVIWGENVELKTIQHPDPPTGCTGLKFDFPLDKVDGEMQICFSLVRPYAVGPVNLCLFGGGQTASDLTICGPSCGSTESCESTFYQKETVCVPVTVSPFAHPGTARTICCGDPVIHTGPQCPGSKTSCTFTVTQSLCIQIPIAFGAVIETGEASVQCGEASETPCDCSDEPSVETPVERTQPETRERKFFTR